MSATPLVPTSCTERTSTMSRKMSCASFWLSAGGKGPGGGTLAASAAVAPESSATAVSVRKNNGIGTSAQIVCSFTRAHSVRQEIGSDDAWRRHTTAPYYKDKSSL